MSDVLRLGPGEYQYRGAEADKVLFMATVERLVPKAVDDLRALWQRYGAAVPAGEVDGWARRYGLTQGDAVPAWVLGVASETCEAWTEFPAWPANRFDLAGIIACGEQLPPALLPPAYEPHIETWEAYLLRLDQWHRELAAVDRAQRESGGAA